MNDFEFDKITQNMDTSLPPTLEDRILCKSSKAFRRSYKIKLFARKSIYVLVLSLFCFGAFISGQLNERQKADHRKYANITNQDTVTITVHQDFLEWINTGHFFTQIDMKEKAAEAFGKAVDLVPKEQLSLALQDNKIQKEKFYKSPENTEFQELNVMAMTNP